MNKLLILISVLLLSGCAVVHPNEGNFGGCKSHCLFGFIGPGNPVFDAYGKHRNTQDPCQLIGKPEGWVFPDYCFMNAKKRVKYVYGVNNNIIYKIVD